MNNFNFSIENRREGFARANQQIVRNAKHAKPVY